MDGCISNYFYFEILYFYNMFENTHWSFHTILVFLLLGRNTIKKQGGMEMVHLTYFLASLFITGGRQDRNSNRAKSWRQGQIQRSRLLACLHGLFSPPSYRTQDQEPRGGTTHHGLGPLSLITKEKTPYSCISLRYFLNWGYFLWWL